MKPLPPLECAHRGCHRYALHGVVGVRASMAACTQHLDAIRQRCGTPTHVYPLPGAPNEPEQPDLFTDTEEGTTA